MQRRILIFIPTYNECENVGPLAEQLLALPLDADILFVDDNSPDGTGALLDRLAQGQERLKVRHRPGKAGIGSAHQDGIRYAYEQQYQVLVTMDCDFTHSPADIPRLLAALTGHQVAVGSRYLQAGSLDDWSFLRKSLTRLGSFATRRLLGIHCDATGAFRAYDLTRLPARLFQLVPAAGYSFFFESMYVLQKNDVDIAELAIVLPKRTYGHSKMRLRDVWRSGMQILSLALAERVTPAQFRLSTRTITLDPTLIDPQGWEAYWTKGQSSQLYALVATIYRNLFIKACLNRAIRRTFPRGAALLHGGCGSGEVDGNLAHEMAITALDICPAALRRYASNNPTAHDLRHGSILALPFPAATFDGVYNLGVMEHFTPAEAAVILAEFHRVLKPQGKVLFFWPHARATSVFVLRVIHWLLQDVLKKKIQLHPAEITHMRSRAQAAATLEAAGFRLVDYRFGPRDLFVQAVVVAERV